MIARACSAAGAMAVGGVLLSLLGFRSGPALHAKQFAEHEPAAVEIQMRRVDLLLAPDIDLEVRRLRGRLKAARSDRPVTFDDSDSFTVEIDTGEVAISPASLTALMNSYVFAYPGAPVKSVSVSISGSSLILKGTLHKGVDLPFEVRGTLSTTPSGEIRVHADKITSAHLPVKGLLHFFGEDLSKLVKQNAGRGLKIDGDDLILSPRAVTPAPHLEGRVHQVAVKDGRIVQVFDTARPAPPLFPPFRSRAYIYHRGGVLQFGKLTMENADLELLGDRSGGPFHFFLHEYKKQLVAGYSKTTRGDGLIVHMADYNRFVTRPSQP